MPSEHRIRLARAEDAPAIAVLLATLGDLPMLAGEDVADVAARHVPAAVASPGTTLLLVEDDGGLIGYANVHWVHDLFMPGPEGYLSELFILDAYRGRGIGSELLAMIETEARERGAFRLSLLNAKRRASYERRFYEQHGWVERPEIANFVRWLREPAG
ncbi:MAG: GNAT family N-acetyltransferase [Thermoleophilia bacterium]